MLRNSDTEQGARGGRSGALALWLCAFLAVWALQAQRAHALSARGHVFAPGLSFAAPGSGAGQLDAPAGVAVSEATGDVYVVDAANNRIDRFAADGAFIEAWGWGVADGRKEYERCSSECRSGLPGSGKFQLDEARSIAVDNSAGGEDPSAGDVYVEANTSEEHPAIDKFGPGGEPVFAIHGTGGQKFEELHGIAVAPSGALWIYDEEELYVFNDEVEAKACSPAESKHARRSGCPVYGTLEPELEGDAGYGLAVDAGGDFYVGQEAFGGPAPGPDVISKQVLGTFGAGEQPPLTDAIDELVREATTGVAVDPAQGDVYVDTGGAVVALDAAGQEIQRFGAGTLHAASGVGLVSQSSVTDAGRAGYLYVADASTDRIDVFVPEEPRAPAVDDVSASNVTSGTAELRGSVDPGGAAASYRFQYGLQRCSQEPSPCASSPQPPGAEVGGGCPRAEEFSCFSDQAVSVELTGLQPSSEYHYRLIAANAHGTTVGGEGAFRTPAATGSYLADGRTWEMVSPLDMNGGEAEPLSEAGGIVQSSASGQALAYVTSAPVGDAEGNRDLEATQLLATRGEDGWSSKDLVTANESGTGLELGTQEYRVFSPDLALSLVQPFEGGSRLAEPPLSPPLSTAEAGHQEKTIYVRADAPIAPTEGERSDYEAAAADGATMGNPGFLALVTGQDVMPGAEFGKELQFLDATPDLSHVVFGSEVPLLPGVAHGRNLYEWSQGELQLVNVLPGEEGQVAPAPQLGDGNTLVRHAVSEDGSRVFWTNAENHLFVRDTTRGETLRLDGSGDEQGHAIFQTASADGSRVFFTDEDALTAGSHARLHEPDLYVCEILEAAGHLTCRLTDLTPGREGESADVLGLVVGADEAGSSVYFMANGALGEGAQPGDCRQEPQPGAACDLYVQTSYQAGGQLHWQPPTPIARLSNEDNPDWEPRRSHLSEPDLGEVTSRVSPNGRYLAFMSDQPLTGYDNRDVAAAAAGKRDEEVFLYDSERGTLLCASCDPSGARPHGVFDPPDSEPANPEGWGLVVDRPKIWQDRWLAGSLPGWTKAERNESLYQSRYLSDSGRLYFDSPADLVPEATNGKEDVYEYEPVGVPSGRHACSSASVTFVAGVQGCLGLVSSGQAPREAAFLDAGQSGGEGEQEAEQGGGDVFFLSAGLSGASSDAGFAVYDAHECTDSSPCLSLEAVPPTSPCGSAEACRPLEYAPPASISPATSGEPAPEQPGSGVLGVKKAKPKPTRAQLLVKALKSCRRLRGHRRRAACEKQARKRYGPAPKRSHAASRGGLRGRRRR